MEGYTTRVGDEMFADIDGLLSQIEFYEQVQNAIKTHPGKYYILCVGIEDFRLIGDLYGREIARKMLHLTAKKIMEHVQEGDFAGRNKGDQFVILLRDDHFDEQSLRDSLTDITETSSPYHIFLHVGIYRITQKSASVVAMCNRASIALDHIEGEEGNCICYYNTTLTDLAHQRRKVIREVEEALDKEYFQIFLQPQFKSDRSDHLHPQNNNIIGAEALVRWNHPEDGILPPGKFVGILEEAGLIYLIDRYVWELAASQLEEWKNTPFADLSISVNISQKDFYYLDIYTIFTELVNEYSLDPAKLRLEINEDSFVTKANKHLIERLARFGFTIVIDNFGSGHSSLSMLKDTCAGIIKIDREFVGEVNSQERSRIILESVIRLSRALGLRIIVSGIETIQELEYLEALGCDEFQGYFFSRPVPVSKFEELYMHMCDS